MPSLSELQEFLRISRDEQDHSHKRAIEWMDRFDGYRAELQAKVDALSPNANVNRPNDTSPFNWLDIDP